jgi:hypothetical protein
MQRTKLQAAVRQAVYGQPQVAIEGFLGDMINGIKSLFKAKKVEIFKKGEEKTNSVHFSRFVERLNKTVLNRAWLSECTLKTDPITEAWAIPGLDYRGLLNPTQPLKHLESAIADYHKEVKLHLSDIEKYKKDCKALYAQMLKALGQSDGSKKSVAECMENIELAYSKVTNMATYVSKRPYEFIGNSKYEFHVNKNQIGYTTLETKTLRDVHKCKHEQLPPLTKEQIHALATLIVKLISDDPYDAINEAQDYVSWETMDDEVTKAGYPSEELDVFNNAAENSVFLAEFSVEHGFDGVGVKELLEVFDMLVIRSLQWINASIEYKE